MLARAVTLDRIAAVLGATPRGDGSWYAADCPDCGTRWSLSLTRRGAECRYDACRRSTCDLRTVVATSINPPVSSIVAPRSCSVDNA